jgi:radical SAM superfamily enzyme YgiQ (UPF0313 family)
MKIALIDLKETAQGSNNKDKTGTFGNSMQGEGFFSKVYAFMKKKNVETPLVHMGYMAAIFRQNGHEVNIYDSFSQGNEDLIFIASSIVGYDQELEFCRKLRKRCPSAAIGFIGAFAMVKPEIFLEEADFVIKGEPEAAVIEMAAGRLTNPRGIIDSPLIQNLESLPFPDWHGFPVRKYGYYPVLKNRPVFPILTSRGCSFDCSYCPYMVIQTKNWRSRSAEHICDEIEYLKKNHGVQSLIFRDIMYTQNKARARRISEEILKRGLEIEWSMETRTDCLDEELLDLMYRSGLRAVHFGIESPKDEIVIAAGRKPIKDNQQVRMIRHCESLGIKVIGFYIIGFLDDTVDSVESTLDYAKRLNTYLAQFDIMTPYPGTRFYEEIKDQVYETDWRKFNTYNPTVKLKHLSPEQVKGFKQKAYRDYYLTPHWLIKNGLKVLFS